MHDGAIWPNYQNAVFVQILLISTRKMTSCILFVKHPEKTKSLLFYAPALLN